MARMWGFLAVFFAVVLGQPARAAWPERAVTLVNLFAPGAATDFAARAVAKALEAKFHQPFVVEARTAAGGVAGTVSVARAAPDGYTLLMTAVGPAVLNPLLFKSVPYDTVKDFAPVIEVGEFPQVIISAPSLGFKSLQDLVAFGRANPGKLNVGHPGAGTMGNLAAALFLEKTGIKGTLVGYRGAAPLVLDVMSGQIQSATPVYTPSERKTTILAVMSPERVPFLSDVPTTREGGVDLIASTWIAILAPAGVPQDVVDKLNSATDAYLHSPEGVQQFATAGIRPLGGSPADLAKVIRDDSASWQAVIAKEHIQLDEKK